MRYLLVIVAALMISSCSVSQNKPLSSSPRETVLTGNMKICAFDNSEYICIAADGAVKRDIFWGEESHSIILVPRQKRWHGKLGLTEPRQPYNIWNTNNGAIRVLVTEAEIRYDSIESALKRLPLYREDGINILYNDSGLLVMWRKTVFPDETVLDLSVFQILINGKKPRVLPGSQNNQLIVSSETLGS